MIYRFLILTILLSALAACSPVMMNGDVISGEGTDLGPVEMSASEHRGLREYSVKAELPDATIFSGKMKSDKHTVTLFSDNGVSMDCDFTMKDPAKSFKAGGTGICTTSDGQKLKVKF